MSALSAARAAAVVTVRSYPAFENRRTATVRLLLVPAISALLYAALATGGGSQSVNAASASAAAASVGALMSLMALSTAIGQDRFEGTLGFVMAATSGRASVWIGRLTVVLGTGGFMALVGLTVTLVATLTAVRPGHLLFYSLMVVLASITSLGPGFALGTISLRMRDSLLLANVSQYVLTALAGAVAPISVLPQWLQVVAHAFPLTHIIQAIRLFHDGAVLSQIVSAVVWSAVSLLAWSCVGLAAWRSLESSSRKAGSFDSLAIG